MKAEELSKEVGGEPTKPMPPLQPIPGVGYPLNVRFPISSGAKLVDSSRIPSPPPTSPRSVDLTSHPLNRSSVTSPGISSPVKYMPLYREGESREDMEEFAKSA